MFPFPRKKDPVRHIVAMRFLCVDFKDGLDVFDPAVIRRWADLADRGACTALANQTDKRFTPVFLINDRIRRSKLSPLADVAARIGAKFVRYGDFHPFLRGERKRCETMIVTRMDSDDLVANDLVARINDLAAKEGRTFVHGYNDGLLYRYGTPVLRRFSVDYTRGHMSAFQSVVLASDDPRLADAEPYRWIHKDVVAWLERHGFPEEEARGMVVHGDRLGEPAYVFIRHGGNASHDGPENDLQYPVAEGVGREWFRTRFGADLDFLP